MNHAAYVIYHCPDLDGHRRNSFEGVVSQKLLMESAQRASLDQLIENILNIKGYKEERKIMHQAKIMRHFPTLSD